MMRIHPAVGHVAQIEAAWESDKKQVDTRAMLIVAALIREGFIAGSVNGYFPVAPENPAGG